MICLGFTKFFPINKYCNKMIWLQYDNIWNITHTFDSHLLKYMKYVKILTHVHASGVVRFSALMIYLESSLSHLHPALIVLLVYNHSRKKPFISIVFSLTGGNHGVFYKDQHDQVLILLFS